MLSQAKSRLPSGPKIKDRAEKSMKQRELLEKLKKKSAQLMEKEKHFHDYAHILGVYKNVEKLLRYEKGNKLVLLTAALFHDVKREFKENHAIEAATYVRSCLKSIPEFPKDLIEQVAKIIKSHNTKQKTHEEKLFYDADKMDAFNELAHARSFMMWAKEGLTLKEACFRYLDLLDHFYTKLHTATAKKLVKRDYQKAKKFALELVKRY